MGRGISGLLILLLALALAACKTPYDPAAFHPELPHPGLYLPDKAVVIFSVTANSTLIEQVDAIGFVGRTLSEPRQLVAGTDGIIRQVARGFARDTSLFMGTLPAGDYEVAIWYTNALLNPATGKPAVFREGLHGYPAWSVLSREQRQRIGKLHLQGGHVYDLGRFVLTGGGQGTFAVGRSSVVKSNKQLVRAYAKEQAPFYDRPLDEGWAAPWSPVDDVEAVALKYPAGAEGLMELKGGTVVAASRMGSLLFRQPGGRWVAGNSGSTDTLFHVTAVDPEDQQLVAVGEAGTIIRASRAGKVERVDPGNLPLGRLVFIDGNDADGWTVASQVESSLRLFQSSRLDGGEWTLAKEISLGSWNDRYGVPFMAWRTPQGFACAGKARKDGKILSYDRKSRQWDQVALADAHVPEAAEVQPGGVISIISHSMGFDGDGSRVLQLSWDHGKTWTRVPAPQEGMCGPITVTAEGEWLFQYGRWKRYDPYRSVRESTGILASKDRGRTWEPRCSEPSMPRGRLIATPTKGLFIVDEGGRMLGSMAIYHSSDGGRTWRAEYVAAP